MYFVDTHTHLYSSKFDSDRDEMINRTLSENVKKLCLPNIDSESIEGMLALEEKYPDNCFPMMGLHPCSVKEDFEKELYIVEEWLSKRKFVAVGEMGTDLYWDKTFFPQQQEAFRVQVNLAKKYDLPIVIHCRDSFRETIELLEPLKDEKLRGIFHCFTGTIAEAEEAIQMGFLLGIGGVLTFKKSGLDAALALIDLKHLVLETDSPYLSPTPHRGKRNESSYIPLIAQKLAEVKQCSVEEIAKQTTQNAEQLFGL